MPVRDAVGGGKRRQEGRDVKATRQPASQYKSRSGHDKRYEGGHMLRHRGERRMNSVSLRFSEAELTSEDALSTHTLQ